MMPYSLASEAFILSRGIDYHSLEITCSSRALGPTGRMTVLSEGRIKDVVCLLQIISAY